MNARATKQSIVGWLALLCYAIHAGFHLAHGRWYDAFWACHIAAVLVGVGILSRSATLNGIGVLLGLLGLPLWLADLAAGGTFFPTSVLTHVVALSIGLYALASLGMPRHTWWKAIATLVCLLVVCRLLTPASANVNVVFAIPPGPDELFHSHTQYLAATLAAATAYLFLEEWLLRKLLTRGSFQTP